MSECVLGPCAHGKQGSKDILICPHETLTSPATEIQEPQSKAEIP